jgi:hypothetical protein
VSNTLLYAACRETSPRYCLSLHKKETCEVCAGATDPLQDREAVGRKAPSTSLVRNLSRRLGWQKSAEVQDPYEIIATTARLYVGVLSTSREEIRKCTRTPFLSHTPEIAQRSCLVSGSGDEGLPAPLRVSRCWGRHGTAVGFLEKRAVEERQAGRAKKRPTHSPRIRARTLLVQCNSSPRLSTFLSPCVSNNPFHLTSGTFSRAVPIASACVHRTQICSSSPIQICALGCCRLPSRCTLLLCLQHPESSAHLLFQYSE